MIEEEVQSLASRYLRSEIQLDRFQRDFALLYAQARRSRQASKLLDQFVLPLAELLRGHRSEASFRVELINALGPFAEQPIANNRFGDPFPFPIAMSNGDNFTNAAA